MTEIYIDEKFAFLMLLSIFCDLVVGAFEYGARGSNPIAGKNFNICFSSRAFHFFIYVFLQNVCVKYFTVSFNTLF